MFAYCLSNPIRHKDNSGYLPVPIILTIDENGEQDLTGTLGAYNVLKKLAAGNPLYEVHHLVEKRFYNVPGIGVYKDNPNKAPAVILPKKTHRGYTNNARKAFSYGINYHNKEAINVNAVKSYYISEYGGKTDWLDLVVSCFE